MVAQVRGGSHGGAGEGGQPWWRRYGGAGREAEKVGLGAGEEGPGRARHESRRTRPQHMVGKAGLGHGCGWLVGQVVMGVFRISGTLSRLSASLAKGSCPASALLPCPACPA